MSLAMSLAPMVTREMVLATVRTGLEENVAEEKTTALGNCTVT